jgi:uncharacterized protein YraI
MWRHTKSVLAAASALLLSAGVLSTPQVAQAQTVTWTGEYFDNPTLSGQPVVVQPTNTIAFNWGLSAPVAGVPADNFSVRWATDVNLSPGTYRFYALADDNIQVIFNYNTTVINTFNTSSVGQTVSGDVTVSAGGLYHIQVDYREVSENAYAYVSFANLATNPTGPNFTAPNNTSFVGGPWTAQYFANTTFSGNPSAIVSVPTPSTNWGTGSPSPAVPVDNWSARFTAAVNLEPGTYVAQLRVDDGVRYIVNGVVLIDRLGSAVGETLTATFTTPGGNTSFQIDYVEYTQNAFLEYQLQRLGAAQPAATTQPGSPSGQTATVTAFRLNVRSSPTATSGNNIITRINRNERYPVLGQTADGRWFQIDVNGQVGFVSAVYVFVENPAAVPVLGTGQTAPQATPITGPQVLATPYNVRIRQGPSTSTADIGRLPVGQSGRLIGRNASNTWWQIEYAGITGWVSAAFTQLVNADVNSIPVTG